jgi:hypothetical protein
MCSITFALILQSSYLDVVLGSGQERWQNNNEERRIYSVIDGLKSKQTAKVYRSTFKEFIKYLQNMDLKVLLDIRPDIIESKIISYLEYLRDTRKVFSGQSRFIILQSIIGLILMTWF